MTPLADKDALQTRSRIVLSQLLDGSLADVLRPLRVQNLPPSRELARSAAHAVLDVWFMHLHAISAAVAEAPALAGRPSWGRVLLAGLEALVWALPLLETMFPIDVRSPERTTSR